VVTSVNTNVNAMAAIASLNDISMQMTQTQGAIESGLKVGSASDNPAVFTIAQGLRANVNALTAVSDNLSTGIATLQGQTTGATSISAALNTLKTTLTQSEGQSGAALVATQAAITNTLANIDSYANATTINGVNMLSSTVTGHSLTTDFLSNVSGSATTVTVASASDSTSLGLTAAAFVTPLTGDQATTTAAIALLDTAIKTIGATLTQLGAGTAQLQGLKTFTDQLSSSNTTSIGAMVDANLSEESAKLSSLQTKQSLAIQSLSIANQGPGALLQLFR
jgi:flagellin